MTILYFIFLKELWDFFFGIVVWYGYLIALFVGRGQLNRTILQKNY